MNAPLPVMDAPLARESLNTAALNAPAPVLSVLIPFHRDDPAPLTAALAAQAAAAQADAEIILYDDGEPDRRLNLAVASAAAALPVPVRVLTATRNLGRAAARNRLAAAARGRWLLFLDADMTLPPGFLARWLEQAQREDADAVFGGYDAAPDTDPAHALHAALARVSDVKSAAARREIGPTAVCTSNLLVRAAVLRDVRFDEGFAGWGWEDVDWAVRAARAWRLDHADNPAGHDGWQPPGALLAKFRDAGRNYARLLSKHPQLAALPGARAARMLRRIPGQALAAAAWAALARSNALPMRARVLALKLWRAAWAAEAMKEARA